jgi:hypothetical protein
MTQEFKQRRISDLAAALVAALPTGKRSKAANTAPTTAAEVAATFGMDYDEDVSNIVAFEMMRIQEANK